MKQYNVKEWFVFAVGAIAMGWQLYKYMMDSLPGTMLDGLVFGASLLLMFAPKTLVDIAGRKIGKRGTDGE